MQFVLIQPNDIDIYSVLIFCGTVVRGRREREKWSEIGDGTVYEFRFRSAAGGSSGVHGGLAFDVAAVASTAIDASLLSGWDYGSSYASGFLAG
ncbi:hypothetical protein FNV43_RR25362 [Rhamnella rubrinervis]|uniref:Uncharacterized protein n=1 Tax=Rhamnella rubrinervis TaxID=2594499 RepID=A0A8K0GQ10_9ROSA|nr:hypothetical protein FNV43_RR25362 [Rhamnella rubrinervis]